MSIPSLLNPRSGHQLEGRHVVLFGAGTANEVEQGWSLGQISDKVYGVGKATALVYARHGAAVTCVDIDLDAATATAELIRSQGGQAFALACDATRSESVKDTIEKSLSYNGRIDVLHNNIGIAKMGGPVECSEENFDQVIAVNLKSMYLTCKWTLPIMERQGKGAIINISSFAAIRFTVPWIAYSASKGAVNALTMGVAAQYAAKGIRCNAIAPGMLSTPMVQSAHKDNHFDLEEMMSSRDNAVPMRWQGEGWDVGEAAAFLASDEARFITGQVLVVDGGSTIMMPSKPWNGAGVVN
ncbi:SDR family oxidoreductase [Mesorhizobium sp. M7A.F.Ca.US.006.01.1.1]|uniref:SDR family NAD(P)-dependent oxidoreductase n=1 Tax=Mesorhizobium sp. M7A.F.Ca.US.006.01.1.1 TaxID=2496707 RepID=UPI000FCBBD2B|nr:SDR family NAD(P)-dependent oxidoreductase [Mesorhizobium sp. M7A.F.Ca.US.006.01.1.1]RUZ81407.1 SDR family oxidoreductase [Mesorhizobium sp. M7A.F.Ca.US.006.01.1.1]